MRFLFGLIVGVALTVGGAWWIDTNRLGGLDGPLVNWERVDRGFDYVREGVMGQVRRVTG